MSADQLQAPRWDYVPTDHNDLVRCLAYPVWRICSGAIYKIMVKSPEQEAGGDPGTVLPFVPNRAQRKLLSRLHYRNIICKARQLGFTTLACIMWLDHALFNADQRCGIVAQGLEEAGIIFRDKVKFAYDNLPAFLREQFPLARDSASELLFAHNNSSVRVAVSMRSGTIHRLHVSEFGKICANHPKKAREVTSGSLPAVPDDGIAIIESTAEGREGAFFTMCQQAQALRDRKAKLTPKDFAFHFFPWWEEAAYELPVDAGEVLIGAKDEGYFEEIEQQIGRALSIEKRRWYVSTRDSTFQGDPELMWQEYPSTPEEAFQVSTEGTYYAVQLADARKQGRITLVPIDPRLPVNTFWDIGHSDGTAIWLHQYNGLHHRFVGYLEGWGEPYSHFIQQLQARRCIWGKHHVPHDAARKIQQGTRIASALDDLQALPIGGKWVVVPRVTELQHGIQQTREAFPSAVFDAEGCKEGLIHLAGYRKSWNEKAGAWSDAPVKNVHTEGADSFRQWAQAKAGIELVMYEQRNPTPRGHYVDYRPDDITGM